MTDTSNESTLDRINSTWKIYFAWASASVVSVFQIGGPSQIADTVVQWLAVDMIYERLVIWVWNKRKRNETMDFTLAASDRHLFVSIVADVGCPRHAIFTNLTFRANFNIALANTFPLNC